MVFQIQKQTKLYKFNRRSKTMFGCSELHDRAKVQSDIYQNSLIIIALVHQTKNGATIFENYRSDILIRG